MGREELEPWLQISLLRDLRERKIGKCIHSGRRMRSQGCLKVGSMLFMVGNDLVERGKSSDAGDRFAT